MMKIDYYKDNITMTRHYHIIIEEGELGMAKFDKFDYVLFKEIDTEESPKISDLLLGLETIARKVEENEDKRIRLYKLIREPRLHDSCSVGWWKNSPLYNK